MLLGLSILYFLCCYDESNPQLLAQRPNGSVFSRAQGLPTDQDDNHAKYLSQKARVFGVGWLWSMKQSPTSLPLQNRT
jgi:hypothetical protein